MVTTARPPVNKRCNGNICVWCLPFHITLFCFRSGGEGGVQHAPRTGSDVPESSRRDLLARHKRCLESAGAKVKESVEIEISPLVSYAGEGLESAKGKVFSKSIVESIEELNALVWRWIWKRTSKNRNNWWTCTLCQKSSMYYIIHKLNQSQYICNSEWLPDNMVI